jgi:hypothetical protein
VDSLLSRAPDEEALRRHRVELLEVRRRRAAGIDVGTLAADEGRAIIVSLAVQPVLRRVRAACDGPLVLLKGPEVALDYPGPRLRRFCDLDLLTDDAERAQAALIDAGFVEVEDPGGLRDHHHLRPLQAPGLPLAVEVHSRPNWPAGVAGPGTGELLASAVPGRTGVDGIAALPAPHHALVLAAHAWVHHPLGRLGDLIDVAVTLRRTDPAEARALARRWGCGRLWRTTERAMGACLEGEGRSAALAIWARHLDDVREQTVLESHVHDVLAPVWALPRRRAAGAILNAVGADVRRHGDEPLRVKLRRARMALADAALPRSEHDAHVAASGFAPAARRGEPVRGEMPRAL